MGRNMDKWLGDGGMPIIGQIGASLDEYGEGWVTGTWTPTDLACNPGGTVQAGVHSVVLDAAMNFAINAGLDGKDRTRGTLEMKAETMRPAPKGERFTIRGDVVRMAKQVCYAEASVKDDDGRPISRATGTFFLHRA
jgi:uncharacterized protein (TIGR00369 family)